MSTEISLIIDIYNGMHYLRPCLDSALRQFFDGYEILLVDDGSTDGSGALADEYCAAHPERIRVIHQENRGLAGSRNTGIREAAGKYIAFVDQDDELEPDYLDRLHSAAAGQDEPAYVVCGYTRIDGNGKAVDERNVLNWTEKLDDGREHVFTYTAWGRLYNRDFLLRSGLWFIEGEGFEDGPFNIYVNTAAPKTTALGYMGYRYRVNETSTMAMVKKTGMHDNDKVMKIPYRGLENTICLLRKNFGNRYDDILCYEIVRNLTGLLFLTAETSSEAEIRKAADFSGTLLRKYFGDIRDNPYLAIGRLKKFPLPYRISVAWFAGAYRRKRIFAYAMFYRRFRFLGRLKKA
ncbi:MAG: glycosyltransferase [Lachnospiraceae bacterium]|jgi:glycosyltransferase involved in cell wall biosynthesis|nr:glycosyltransferase [Lachnospiraceae bacterium]